jgi:hypothetical protein
MSTLSTSAIYLHADHPEWGRGIILPASAARADRLDLSFEVGGRRILMKTFAQKLQAAEVTPLEAKTLLEKLSVRRASHAPIKAPRNKATEKKTTVLLADFAAQLELFLSLFPGSFQGEKYERLERTGGKSKKGAKDVAVAKAAKAFVPGAFAGNGDEVYAAAADLARSSGLVHPLDGATTLASIPADKRPVFLAGLQGWLFGTGDEEQRFTAFVAAIAEAAGPEAKRPSWPLVTSFAALVQPKKHVCVKPTTFQRQAALLSLPLDYSPSPNYAAYQQFLAIANATEARLTDVGEKPRDLLDVSAFISLTQSPQPKPTVG